MIYLDNSATTYPKPLTVKNAVSSALSGFGANPGRGGYKMAQDTNTMIYGVRKKVSDFFNGGGAENVIFYSSCTAALNQVIFGKLNPGDHVVVSDMEHNAVMRPIYSMSKLGVEFTVAKTYPGDNDATVNAFRSCFKNNTKLVVCTAASNVWGIRLPFDRIAALCHVYGIEICVDGAQAAGIVPIDIIGSGIDYLCIPGHKGLYGPMGIGVLITDKGSGLKPLIYGGTGVNSQSFEQPDEAPERFESGTINVPAIAGLGAAVDFVRSKGIDNIRNSELSKVDYLYRELNKMQGVKLYTAEPKEPYFVPVLSFTGNETSEKLCEMYAAKGAALRCGLHCAPSAHEKMGTKDGTVRISPSIFTTKEEIAAFVRISKILLKA